MPYGRQKIDNQDIRKVVSVLKNDLITQGNQIQKFESGFSKYVGAKYAVACSSGTAALHLSCLALGLGVGKSLLTTPISFVATANCAEYVGAKVIFSDIEKEYFCLSAEKLEQTLKKKKIHTVALVHMGGHSADLYKIHKLKKKYKFNLIEDACHGLGGTFNKKKIGACFYSDISTFSFHPVKNITTGEGGMITTNDKSIYEKLLLLRSHGINKNKKKFVNKILGFNKDKNLNPGYYEMVNLGFNYRITDFQAALGLSQLSKLKKIIKRKREIAKIYNKTFSKNKYIEIPKEKINVLHAYHLYTLIIDFKKLGKSRGQIMQELKKKKIGTQILYIPIHLQPYYSKKYKYKYGNFPEAEKYYNNCLSIPIFPDLKNHEVNYIVKTISKIIS